jgi:hypothetical protein
MPAQKLLSCDGLERAFAAESSAVNRLNSEISRAKLGGKIDGPRLQLAITASVVAANRLTSEIMRLRLPIDELLAKHNAANMRAAALLEEIA